MESESKSPGARAYRQVKRAANTQETTERIAQSMHRLMKDHWLEDITLDAVAEGAKVSVQTVLRHYGSKEGLISSLGTELGADLATKMRRNAGSLPAVIRETVKRYEEFGDTIVRTLAQEERHAALKVFLDSGRQAHRNMTEAAFSEWLPKLSGPNHTKLIDALVTATDVTVWKLLRRDLYRTEKQTAEIMLTLVQGAIDAIGAESG